MKENGRKRAIESIRNRLGDDEVFVSVKGGNVRYLSYSALKDPIASAVIISRDGEKAIVSSLEMNRASDLIDMDMMVFSPYPQVRKDGVRLASLIKRVCGGKNIVSDARIDGVRTRVKDLVAQLRMVKSAEELELIKKANRITRDVDLSEIVKEGKKEIDIAREVEDAMLRNGAESFAFDTIVACNKHSAYSHHEPGKMKFKESAIVDYGARYHGYCADVTRTIIEGNKRLESIKGEIERAVDTVVDKFSEGSKCSEIDRALRVALGKLSRYFYHGTGHGIGLEVHEPPSLSTQSRDVLEKNMVFTIEPGVYIKGLGGVRIEDDFYVDGKIKRL